LPFPCQRIFRSRGGASTARRRAILTTLQA